MDTSSPIDQGEAEQPSGLTRRATIGDPVYDNQALVRQRRKAAVVACDRCRRRKIRCDGLQPCATCARFGVRCARAEGGRERSGSAAEHAALADRVRQLEARLAAVTANDTPGQNVFDEGSGRPALHLDTSFDHPGLQRSFSFNDMTNETPMTDESFSLTVPTIQITGPHGSRPGSPMPFSPSPSLFSGTSRASSPDPFSAMTSSSFGVDAFGTGGMLAPFPQGSMRTPPVSQWVDAHDRSSMLQAPESPTAPGWLSRRSSISSFGGLDQGFCAMNLEMPLSPHGDWNESNPFDMSSSVNFDESSGSDPLPSKAQAEGLAEHAFANVLIPLERTAFKICLEAVYDVSDVMSNTTPATHTNLSSFTPYSLRMARCMVFLILSIGLRFQGSAGNSSTGIDSCYAIAHEQMRSLDFWAERGAQEVAGLLAALGSVSTQ